MLNEVTNRLDEIAERNTHSRHVDWAFAFAVTLLMIVMLVSLRNAGALLG